MKADEDQIISILSLPIIVSKCLSFYVFFLPIPKARAVHNHYPDNPENIFFKKSRVLQTLCGILTSKLQLALLTLLFIIVDKHPFQKRKVDKPVNWNYLPLFFCTHQSPLIKPNERRFCMGKYGLSLSVIVKTC